MLPRVAYRQKSGVLSHSRPPGPLQYLTTAASGIPRSLHSASIKMFQLMLDNMSIHDGNGELEEANYIIENLKGKKGKLQSWQLISLK